MARSLRYESLEDRRLLAVLTVDTDQDVIDFNDGKTSLREAIFAANIVPGADEIVFDFGHDGPATILLTQGELQVTDHLTIMGSGAELLTIDASGSDPTPNENNGDGSRFFNLIGLGQDRPAYNIALTGMTITGGDSAAQGGGIRSTVRLTLKDTVVAGNSGSDGGAIYQGGAVLTSARSTFRDNFATTSSGGAISSNAGTTFIEQSTFEGNRAQLFGGAIYVSAGKLQILDGTVKNNWSEISGGGISILSQANLEMRRCNVESNVANLGAGGGIFLHGSSGIIANSLIAANYAGDAGGGVAGAGHLEISHTTISGNSGILGGGIASGGSIKLNHSMVFNNRGRSGGGGIWAVVPVWVVDHSIVAGNLNNLDEADDVRGNVTSSFSLISEGAEFLGPLADNGGPTKNARPAPRKPRDQRR